jgi:outer membrane receptor protein involved in Fe transport
VLRQEALLFGARIEFKFEARNLTGQDYEEYQRAGDNRIDINSYEVGQSFSLGATVHF